MAESERRSEESEEKLQVVSSEREYLQRLEQERIDREKAEYQAAQQEAEEERATRDGKSDREGGKTLEQLSDQLLRKIQAFFSY